MSETLGQDTNGGWERFRNFVGTTLALSPIAIGGALGLWAGVDKAHNYLEQEDRAIGELTGCATYVEAQSSAQIRLDTMPTEARKNCGIDELLQGRTVAYKNAVLVASVPYDADPGTLPGVAGPVISGGAESATVLLPSSEALKNQTQKILQEKAGYAGRWGEPMMGAIFGGFFGLVVTALVVVPREENRDAKIQETGVEVPGATV